MFEDFEKIQVAANGVSINLVHGGSGPPLLLLHGYPQTHVEWHKMAPALAEHYTVVAPDLRGYGKSHAPKEQHLYDMECLVNDVDVLLKTYAGCPGKPAVCALLVGMDVGAIVAWHYVKMNGSKTQPRVGALCLIGPPPGMPLRLSYAKK